MDNITTATGKEFSSDYLSAIPNPKMTFFRILDLPFADVATVFSNPEETANLYYHDYVLSGCTLVAIAVENDAVKVSMNYETLEKKESEL